MLLSAPLNGPPRWRQAGDSFQPPGDLLVEPRSGAHPGRPEPLPGAGRPPLPAPESNEEAAILHDLAAVDPHVGAAGQHIDMARALPVSARLVAVRIAECHMDTGELLVLQEVAHDRGQTDVRPDRELARSIGVWTLAQVGLDLGADLGMAVHLHGHHATAADMKPHWLLQEAITPGEVITQLLPNQQAIDAERCREDLSLREVAPAALLPVASVARYPAVPGREGRGQLGAEARGDLDPGRLAHDLIDAMRDLVDLLVVHGHAVEHQGTVDSDHVAVPAAQVAREQLQHRGPECELTWLAFTDEE